MTMPMQASRKYKIIGFIILIILAGLAWHFWGKKNHAGAGNAMPPMPVSVAVAKNQAWQQQIAATGTLNAPQGVMLKSEVAGRVTKIYFASGQNVKAGDALLDVNPSILQAQLAAAVAKANLSKGDYLRAQALAKRGALSQQDLETAHSSALADAANVIAVKAQLDQNQIRAPFSGKLGLSLFNLGDYITAGQSLVNLQALNPLRVDFNIPQNYLGRIQVGDKVQIQSDAFPNKIFNASVSAIDSAIDPNTRSVAIRANVANPDQKLLPGGFVQVTLFAGKPRGLVTIPQLSVVYDATGDYVYAVINGHAVKKPILIANQNNDQVAVVSGLPVGAQVVTAGQIKLSDGSPVMPLPSQARE